MSELIDWLRAQLAEDERLAKAWLDNPESAWWWNDPAADSPAEQVIARNTPQRLLNEAEAKQRILAEHPRYDMALDRWCITCDIPADREGPLYGCPTVRLLAVPYADRPGYQERWRP